DQIGIDDIAAAAGVSKGLLYHYFPSKRRFYVEVVRAAADHMLVLTEPAGDDLAPVARLRAGLDAYLDYVEENARAYAALFRSGLGIDREVQTIVEDCRAAMIERIVRKLGVDEPPPLVRLALRGWIGMVESAI